MFEMYRRTSSLGKHGFTPVWLCWLFATRTVSASSHLSPSTQQERGVKSPEAPVSHMLTSGRHVAASRPRVAQLMDSLPPQVGCFRERHVRTCCASDYLRLLCHGAWERCILYEYVQGVHKVPRLLDIFWMDSKYLRKTYFNILWFL